LTKIRNKKIIAKFMVMESNKSIKIKIPFDFIFLEYNRSKRSEDHLNSLFWNLTRVKSFKNFHGFGM